MALENDFLRRVAEYIKATPNETVSGFAERAGMSNATLRLAIKRNGGIGTTNQQKILRYLNMTMSEFMDYEAPQDAAARVQALIRQLNPDEALRVLGFAEAVLSQRDPAPEEDQ